MQYRTNCVWPAASSEGISLERWPLNSYGNDLASWRTSRPGGTPGRTFAEDYSIDATISVANGDHPRVTFHAIPGESYEIHCADRLIDADWQPLFTVPGATTNRIEAIDDSPGDRVRFYRITWSY